jgi:hypothetical protein
LDERIVDVRVGVHRVATTGEYSPAEGDDFGTAVDHGDPGHDALHRLSRSVAAYPVVPQRVRGEGRNLLAPALAFALVFFETGRARRVNGEIFPASILVLVFVRRDKAA